MTWTIEERLLLHIAGEKKEPCPLEPHVDPRLLLDAALREGMAGFVYRRFHKTGFPAHFDGCIQKEWEREYFSVLARNLLLKKDCNRALALLSNEHVPALMIQGFPLLDSVYDDYGLRPLCDVDLLLPEASLQRAREVLSRGGFTSPENFPSVFIRGNFQVDLHTDILNMERIGGRKDYIDLKFEDLQGPYTVPASDLPGIFKLRPEANFPLLSLHLAKHSFNRLIWFVDLLRIMTRGPAFDPEVMIAIAKAWNLLPAVLIPVIFIRECLGGPVPKALQSRIRQSRWSRRCVVRMIIHNHRFKGLGDYFMMSQIKGPGKRLRYVTEYCFPKREVMAQIYPDLEGRWLRGYGRRIAGLFLDTLRNFARL